MDTSYAPRILACFTLLASTGGCVGSPIGDSACRYSSSTRTDWDTPHFGVTATEVVDVLVDNGDVPVELVGGPVEEDQFTWTFEPVGRPRVVDLVWRRRTTLVASCTEGPALDIEVEAAFQSDSGLSLPPHPMMVRVYENGEVQLFEDFPSDEISVPPVWSDFVAGQLEDDPGYEARGVYPMLSPLRNASLDEVPSMFDEGTIQLIAEHPVGVQSTSPSRWSRVELQLPTP